MLGRFLFNALLFFILLFGIGGFVCLQSGDPRWMDALVVALLGSAWAGILVAIVEVYVYAMPIPRRLALAAVAGGGAYFGLFAGMAFLAGFGMRPSFLALGVVVGAISHAARAKLYGGDSAGHD